MRKGFVVALASLFAVACLSVSALAAEKGGLSMSEKAFIKNAASSGEMEVQLGKVAQTNASSQAVKDFGKKMETDHQKANDELKAVASKANLQLPSEPERKHKSMVEKLSKVTGEKFDKYYMKDMVKAHKKDVADFQQMSKKAKDPALKAFVDKTLPVLQQHLEMATQTAQQVGAQMTEKGKEKTKK